MPVLLLHGDADPVVPVEQSQRLAAALAAAGGDVELHVYPGEGHGFRQPEHQLDEYRRMGAFFERVTGAAQATDSVAAVTDDWNPNDPDATRVHYDLSRWSFDQQAELASDLAEAEIPHAWDGNELLVPEEFEIATDTAITLVEERLGIDDEAAGRRADAPRG